MLAVVRMTTVFEAWSAVMNDVKVVHKGERNQQQGFSFRGIDAVMLAVGPKLRAHSVTVVPTAESIETERYTTAKGGLMQGIICRVQFTVYGPEGDSFTGSAYGQAADSGDKAVSKAHSVAYRTFLLQALCVPTDEPDPDSQVHERAIPARRSQASAQEPPGWEPDATKGDPTRPRTEAQSRKLFAVLREKGLSDRDEAMAAIGDILGREVESTKSLTVAECSQVIDVLEGGQ